MNANWIICIVLVTASAFSWILRTQMANSHYNSNIAQSIPEKLQHWQKISQNPTTANTLERIYSNGQQRIMLSISWNSQQGEAQQSHRPEYCYQAQGFTIQQSIDEQLHIGAQTIPIRRLHTQRNNRQEMVSYWLTIGQQTTLPGWSRKLTQLQQFLSGNSSDSLLIRVSSISADARAAYALQDEFLRELLFEFKLNR